MRVSASPRFWPNAASSEPRCNAAAFAPRVPLFFKFLAETVASRPRGTLIEHAGPRVVFREHEGPGYWRGDDWMDIDR